MERKLFFLGLLFLLVIIILAVSARVKENKRLARDCYESTLGFICEEDFKPDPYQCVFSCRSASPNWKEFKLCATHCQKETGK
jgi:hypothetical protein